MVSESITTAVLVGVFTLIGSLGSRLLNMYSTQNQINEENKRWKAEFLLDKKVESLTEFHTIVEDSKRVFIDYSGIPRKDMFADDETIEEMREAIAIYEHAMERVTIYLDEEQEETITDMFVSMNAIEKMLAYQLDPEAKDHFNERAHKFFENYYAVRDMLRSEISEPIDAIEVN